MRKTLAAALLFSPMAALAQNIIPAPDQLPQPDGPPAASILDLPAGATPPRSSGPPHICMPPGDSYYIVHKLVGPTIVSFKITTEGTVRGALVRQSSGDPSVDLASVTCVTSWLYAPAMANGRPLEVSLTQSIDWNTMVLRGDAPADRGITAEAIHLPVITSYQPSSCEAWHHDSEKGVLLAFNVDTGGRVKDVSILQSSGNSATDRDATECISRRPYQPALQHGRALEVRLADWLYWPRHCGWFPGTCFKP